MASPTYRFVGFILQIALACAVTGCATSPQGDAKREQLHDHVTQTLQTMQANDPSLGEMLQSATGYAVFPSIGKGGFIFGGAYGRGEVYERGQMIGWADVTQEHVGAVVGGETFSELIVFQDIDAMNRFKMQPGDFLANLSATLNQKGSARTTRYDRGLAVFVRPMHGLMLEASVGGQQFTFQPK